MSDFAKLIGALLRGERVAWIETGDGMAASRFIAAARFHGVLPLLDRRFAESSDGWPDEIVHACRRSALYEAMLDLARRAELSWVLEALYEAGIPPLVLKGSALAYTHYANPALRPRSDTDVLIPPDARGRASQVLRDLGYMPGGGMTGALVSYQSTWSRQDGVGATHHLDIHWRINNSQILAKLLSYTECEASSIEVPALGRYARGLGSVLAALFACMHRAGHRNAPVYVDGIVYDALDRLIWLYDIHLLCSGMSEREMADLVARAEEKRLRAICLDALESANRYFATPILPTHMQRLARPGPKEPSAFYLYAGPARQMLGDLFAIESMAGRIRWLGEVAFPSREYMRRGYADSPNAWLPVLYARRGVRGLWRLALSLGSSRRSTLPVD